MVTKDMTTRKALKSTLGYPNTGSRAGSMVSQHFWESTSVIKISYYWGFEDYIDALEWIELYDMITADYNWTNQNRVARFGGYLRKNALAWWVQVIKTHHPETTHWPQYKDLFVRRFSSSSNSTLQTVDARISSSKPAERSQSNNK